MLLHVMHIYVCNKLSVANNLQIYRMIQDETSIFSEIIISVIVKKTVHMNMCLIWNGYRDRAVSV